jgi:hypothetical protein
MSLSMRSQSKFARSSFVAVAALFLLGLLGFTACEFGGGPGAAGAQLQPDAEVFNTDASSNHDGSNTHDGGGSGSGSDGGSGSGSDAGSGSGINGTCAHAICTAGSALESTCSSCTTEICSSDSYCCNTNWDTQCVNEVSSVCSDTCP